MISNYEVKTFWRDARISNLNYEMEFFCIWNNSIPLCQIIKGSSSNFQNTSTFSFTHPKFSKSITWNSFVFYLCGRTDIYTHTEIKKCLWWKQGSRQAKGFYSGQLVLIRWRVCSVWKRRELHFNFLSQTIFNIFLHPFYQFLGVRSYIPEYFTFSSLVSWLLSKKRINSHLPPTPFFTILPPTNF